MIPVKWEVKHGWAALQARGIVTGVVGKALIFRAEDVVKRRLETSVWRNVGHAIWDQMEERRWNPRSG